jgi:hypothetical protein
MSIKKRVSLLSILPNKEAKRIANEADFLALSGFNHKPKDTFIINKITSIFR